MRIFAGKSFNRLTMLMRIFQIFVFVRWVRFITILYTYLNDEIFTRFWLRLVSCNETVLKDTVSLKR